jgi:hypothetical protein
MKRERGAGKLGAILLFEPKGDDVPIFTHLKTMTTYDWWALVPGNQKFPSRDKQQSKVLVSSHAGCFQGSAGELSLSLQTGHDRMRRDQKAWKSSKGFTTDGARHAGRDAARPCGG